MIKSILQSEKECYFCGTTEYLELHHCIHGIANRQCADDTGLTVYLCHFHHEMVHHQRKEDLKLIQMAQETFEQTHTREEFRAIFGKSWL